MRINSPALAPDFAVNDISGRCIRLSELRGQRVMLSFFRDVACPFCNLRVYELSNEYESLKASKLEIVTFFRSSDAEVQRFVARRPRPFSLIADPQMTVYRPYGIERSRGGMMLAMMRRLPRLVRGLRIGQSRLPAGDPSLMPADFLIDERGYIRHAYYGRDLGDHLPLQHVHSFAARE
ncbi:redoxin domain-containing protein [Rhodanobacter denitrificans]|uniref:peroxiredoxin family protein n=1 Tax=Rhodanobacter denitrificans TaxID=666685 RepID=UPI000260E668|nr:redoxin domain-containing protein [Rhodanobacter denitrificans]EIL99497.1 alkyl hydroperoxide reductase [Rhodanobacter denitrificans]UJM90706.1 redoxin domain-containing protein [Rhodanobacter denitrificans]